MSVCVSVCERACVRTHEQGHVDVRGQWQLSSVALYSSFETGFSLNPERPDLLDSEF